MASERTRILFVCLGNICRSPLAEAIFREETRRRGVEQRFEIDSAGTSGYHAGCAPDRRSVETAQGRGVTISGTSRQITEEDLHRFDLVIAMDADNYGEIDQLKAAADGVARIHRLREWDSAGDSPDVPDPYYGGPGGFGRVHEIVERCCVALLDDLISRREAA
ncbi:low molecular weight protein-tyrosine-phosphatase [soil metagenome]